MRCQRREHSGVTAEPKRAPRGSISVPRYGTDDCGNEVVLVRRLGLEQSDGSDCEHCGEPIDPNAAAYRDQFLSIRGNWYTHASPGECISFVHVDPDDWTTIPARASR